MKDMIQVTRQLLKQRCFNPNGFEKNECVGKKLKNIAPNNRTYSVDEVKILLEKQKQACANEFIHGEMAWTSFSKAMRIKTYSRAKALQEGKIHPTQKPVTLYEWQLQLFAKEGDLILDTHVGSGSIRIACDKGGFNFTGFEIDTDYWKAQEKRFKNFAAQLTFPL